MKTTAFLRIAAVMTTAYLSIGLVRAAFAPGTNLYLNGGLASSQVIQHNGVAYAPIADIAKALNQTVVKKADGYAITSGDGGDPLSGSTGKIGDKLTSGPWVLTVVKAFRTDKYVHQFDTGTSTPNQASDDVVVVVVQIKNARQESAGISLPGTSSTTVTDNDSHAYGKMTFGGVDDHTGYPTLLPGSAVDFALCFSFPKTAKLGDLVYQVYPSSGSKPPTFRVSLASANP